MPYHPNIPRSTDNPSVSQSDLLDNFGQINTSFAVNHVPLTQSSNSGMHTKITFPKAFPYVTDPNLVSPASSVYPKVAALGGSNELFFQNGNLFSNVVQLTGLPIVNGTIQAISQAANGVVTTKNNHGLANNDMVTLYGVYGMTNVNAQTYTISGVTTNTFQLNSPTNLFPAYAGGGFYMTASSTNKGIATPWGVIINFGTAVTGPGTINYAIPFANANNVIIVSNQGNSAVSNPSTSSPSTTSTNYISAVPIYYFAMGI